MVCCIVPAQKLFSKSLATPDISGLRSASLVCFTPGTRSSSFIRMSTVSSPPGGLSLDHARWIRSRPRFFLPLASFSPFKYSDVCFAASSSPLSSRLFSMTSCTSPAIWLYSRNPRSSLLGSDHCSEKTGSSTPNHPSAVPTTCFSISADTPIAWPSPIIDWSLWTTAKPPFGGATLITTTSRH